MGIFRKKTLAAGIGLALTSALLPAGAGAQTAQLEPRAEQGRQIYLEGTSPSGGKIEAVLSNGQTVVSGALFPCANCHGEDGKGRSEGGITAAEVTWHALTKPYVLKRPDRRARPPYRRDGQVTRAFTMGLDSGGKALNTVMPRYRMSREDALSLIAYLKVLGQTGVPGVTETSITLAVAADTEDEPATTASPSGPLLRYFSAVNDRGGIYGRRIKLTEFKFPSKHGSVGDHLSKFMEEARPLAFIVPSGSAHPDAVARELSRRNVPLLAAAAEGSPGNFEPGGPLFAVLPGLAEEARALARLGIELARRGSTQPVIASGRKAPWTDAGAAAAEEFEDAGGLEFSRLTLAPPKVKTTTRAGIALVLAPKELASQFIADIEKRHAGPVLLAPMRLAGGIAASGALPAKTRLLFSWPSLPSEINRAGGDILRHRTGSGTDPLSELRSRADLAAAAVMVEALRRAGRDLSRSTLIKALEGIYNYETGLVGRVTFDANRRLGRNGVHVLEFDPVSGRPIGGRWVKLEDDP
ncbi:MAG: ABC transporter substrate-binding protein [Pseudomonadota bacterium]